MPQEFFKDAPVLKQWFEWGVFLGFGAALLSALWVFYDSQRSGQEAMGWKALAVIGTVLVIPFVLASLSAPFADQVRTSMDLLAYLSLASALAAVVGAIGYTATRTQTRCPICQRPMQAGWDQCPYHAQPATVGFTPPIQAGAPIQPIQPTAAAPVLQPTVPQTATGQTATVPPLMSQSTGVPPRIGGNVGGGEPAPTPGQTIILGRPKEPQVLGWLVIRNGPRVGATLPLKQGVTRIGRGGADNDHVIDDAAVSRQHLSIRYAEGNFVLSDLDSNNGTFVNEQRVPRHTLQANDVVRIGQTELVFMSLEPGPRVVSTQG
ncbi:MAG: FHA domain-containing protein [Chloroflexi bacterium]|nr:FHA domain-containing protein [Chloroflexota bacterium]